MTTSIASTASQRPIVGGCNLDAKVAFLSTPTNYPEPTSNVDAVETHMSWVFLTDRHAYKLKKPVRNADVDLRTVAARQANCAEEVQLNRRLAPDVYLGTVPLAADARGALALGERGAVVDWLVRMRRLPAERMLDRRIAAGCVGRDDVDALIRELWNFYRRSPPVVVIAAEYRGQFHDDVVASQAELCTPEYGVASELVDRIGAMQLSMLARHGALFDARVRDRRIVEGHGDLRPEHVCLEAEPRIIDCLEFSRVLRTLDIADELGYLALECERLGAPQLRDRIFACYRERSGDAPPDALVHFYQSYRACVRATLALRHLHDPRRLPDRAAWTARALDYLELARVHAEHCRS